MTQMPNFFMVLADNSDQTRVRHCTLEDARREAARLATLNPGLKFFVLASLGHMVRENPTRWEAHDDIPF